MKRLGKKLTAAACMAGMMGTMLTGCGSAGQTAQTVQATQEITQATTAAQVQTSANDMNKVEDTGTEMPKHIFLFIGDGMAYSQIQATSYYLGAVESQGEVVMSELSFTDFPTLGSVTTYDSTSFCPDSASTATSIASGEKTYSGTINKDITFTRSFETIAEKLKAQKDYSIGVISSVNLNHATPAAFYAHQDSRNSYYEIGMELIASDFEYFAGGALKKVDGDGTQENLYELAEKAGYTVTMTQEEAEAVNAETGKAILIDEHLADSDSMAYSIDAAEDEWKLADYVEKGIEVLEGDEDGFFMAIEGGKIDWACHANDAASTLRDVLALSDAVQVAVDFYNEHPDDTLIIVTGDHETGGLTIGFAGTNYDTFLTNLENQTISYAKFDSDYVAGYKENQTDFETAMADVKSCFGLMMPGDPDAAEGSTLVLTQYEVEEMREAYQRTLAVGSSTQADMAEDEYVLYGTYEPFSVTITHLLNNKSGVNFSSYAHTGLTVPVFALGAGAEDFEGYYDNTDIFGKMAALMGVQ